MSSQRDDVRDGHHVEAGRERAGPVAQDAEHLRTEVSEQAGAEADDAHRVARLAARHHAAGEAVELIRRREAEADHRRRRHAEDQQILDRQRRGRDGQQDEHAAEHDELVEAVGQQRRRRDSPRLQ